MMFRVEIVCKCCGKKKQILASQVFFGGYSYCDNCNRITLPFPCDHKPWRRVARKLGYL